MSVLFRTPWGIEHRIDPVLFEAAGIEAYWYGLAYALGFLGIFLWFRARRPSIGWSRRDVYDLSIVSSLSVLLCGRAFSVFVYHWDYFREHPGELFHYWRGGMTSHGLLIGGLLGMVVFSRWRKKPLLQIADEMVVPAAFLLGLGRIGNFVNGQIVGSETDVWWGIRFPGFDDYRHPVTLYESLKNFAIVPLLLWLRRRYGSGRGIVAANFVLWYGFLRIFADLFRDYAGTFLGIGKGQYFNLLMAALGLVLLVVFHRRAGTTPPVGIPGTARDPDEGRGLWPRRIAFLALLLFSLVVRSGWSQDVIALKRGPIDVGNQQPLR